MGPNISKVENENESSRLPVKLSKCKKMIISNRHLRELYNNSNTKQKLRSILFELTKDEVFFMSKLESNNKNIKDSDKLNIPFNNESWKCQLQISWQEIEILRNWMHGYHERRLGRTDWRKCEMLMLRRLAFDKSDNKQTLISSDEEDDELVKKSIIVQYDKTLLAPVVLNIHVHSKV
jgi:hypothetical protein